MATRGLFGFRKDGVDKAVYNHCDSYPEWLGSNFVELIAKNSDKLNALFENIVVIDPSSKPTEEQKDYCKKMGWYDSSVSENSDDDWYCLLRGVQDIEEWQKAIDKNEPIYIENNIDFIKQSLFCEYAYICDLDADVLEFYVGFQTKPDNNNRYGQDKIDECYPCNKNVRYYPCKMVLSIPFNDMKNNSTAWIVERMVEAKKKR